MGWIRSSFTDPPAAITWANSPPVNRRRVRALIPVAYPQSLHELAHWLHAWMSSVIRERLIADIITRSPVNHGSSAMPTQTV